MAQIDDVIAKAEEALGIEEIEKGAAAGMFGYPAGKSIIVNKIVPAMIPAHKTYTEVFAGSAAVFFKKERAPVEVLNDIDSEVIGCYKAIQRLTDEGLAKLMQKKWSGDKSLWAKLKAARTTSEDDPDAIHKFMYLRRFTYGRFRDAGYDHNSDGIEMRGVEARVKRGRERLKGVKLFSTGDYDKLVAKYDGKDSFHFMDPPYAGYNAAIGEKNLDEARLRKCMSDVQGSFLLTYGSKGKLDYSGFFVKKVKQPRTIRAVRGVSQSKFITHLFVSNYKIGGGSDTEKSLGLVDVEAILDVPEAIATHLVKAQALALALEDEVMPFLTRARRFSKGDPGRLVEGIAKSALSVAEHLDRFAFDDGEPITIIESGIGDVAKALKKEVETLSAAKLPASLMSTLVEAIPYLDRMIAMQGQLGSISDGASYSIGKGEWAEPSGENLVPDVLRPEAVAQGAMPPDGFSGLPVSLEAVVPPELRYWQTKGEDARLLRDALVAREIFTPVTVVKVDGDLRLVRHEVNTFLVDPIAKADVPLAVEKIRGDLIAFDGHTRTEKGEPARDKCMQCKAEPEVEVIWADGRGRAWFDKKCFKEWKKGEAPDFMDREIVRERAVTGGSVGAKFGEASKGIRKKVYKTVEYQGLAIKVDRPKGFVQSGKDDQGNEWSREYKVDYGFFPRTKGGDDDELDVFVGPDSDATEAFWVTQKKADGSFDEFKVFVGFASKEAAKKCFADHIPMKFFGGIASVPIAMMKSLLNEDPQVVAKGIESWTAIADVTAKLHKADSEERFVLGEVLVPEDVDAQKDIYSADEVRNAAHKFMEDYRNVGLMHRSLVNTGAKIVESYIAPCDFTVGDAKIKKGTWMLAVRVLDEKLWKAVKGGELTGFSIGGSAQRVPEGS